MPNKAPQMGAVPDLPVLYKKGDFEDRKQLGRMFCGQIWGRALCKGEAIKSAVKLRLDPGCLLFSRASGEGKGCGRLTSDSLKSTGSSCDLVMQMTWSGVIGDQQCIAYNSFKLVMPRSLASTLSATLRWSELIRTTLELISWFMSNWADYSDYNWCNWLHEDVQRPDVGGAGGLPVAQDCLQFVSH